MHMVDGSFQRTKKQKQEKTGLPLEKTVVPPDKDFAAAYGAPNSHNFYSHQLVQ
jgi:hypothetical protein